MVDYGRATLSPVRPARLVSGTLGVFDMRHLVLACALVVALPSTASASFEALLAAARTRSPDAVSELLLQGSDPNPPYESYDGYTPLMFAAGNGDAGMTRMLLAAGAGTERRDHNGERALEWATRAYYLHPFADVPTCVRLLLDAGSPADSDGDRLGMSPLMHASQYGGHAGIIRMLLDAGADPNRIDDLDQTALHRAAERDGEAVALLLAAGADPNVAERTLGGTPLHAAAQGSAVANARLLLEAGASTEPRYYRGQTALFIAAASGADGVVEALLAAGAEVDAADDDGLTPVLAAITGDGEVPPERRAAAALLLAERTADLDRAFAAAIGVGFDEAAARLFARGAGVDAVDHNGRSALAAAAARADPAWFDRLIEAGADLARHGGEALGAAARAGLDDRVERLLGLDVDVDARDPAGATALMRAAAAGRIETVALLVAKGADRHAADEAGNGVGDYMAAARRSYEEAITRAEGSRAFIDVSGERAAMAGLDAAHAQVLLLLGP